MEQLDGGTAVITGAGSGIGRAMAARFAAAGMRIVAADIEQPALDTLAAELRAPGHDIVTRHCDVMDPAQVEAVRDLALETYGRIDLVCNNAGVGGPNGRSPHELTVEDYEWVIGIDLWGVIHGVRTFMPVLLDQGTGHMVNTASLAGLTSGASISAAYYVAKHGVVALSESIFHDLRSRGSDVGVSVLCPGFVATSILADAHRRPESLVPPGGVESTPEQERVEEAMRDLLSGGHTPDHVAELVHDAVLAGTFYIFTQADAMAAIEARHRAIETGGFPPMGRMDRGLLGEGPGA
jgi:NAD(P)-dependent dehydrogenase (short-subunit alcohol dehydrogenase family)